MTSRSGIDPEPGTAPAPGHEPHHRLVVGTLLTAGVGVLLTIGYLRLLRENADLPAVARYAMEVALPQWKLSEPVNEVVYGTRGFDTFGETFLLLAAVISVIMITRPREPRRGYFGEETAGRREQCRGRSAQRARPRTGAGAGSREGGGGGARRRGRRPAQPSPPGDARRRTGRHSGARACPRDERRGAHRHPDRGSRARHHRPLPGGLGLFAGRRIPGRRRMLGVALLVYAGFGAAGSPR